MKGFKLFWFRLKLRLFAPEMCPIHFIKKEWTEKKIRGKYREMQECSECQAVATIKRQKKRDHKHFRKDELQLQCMMYRRMLGMNPIEQRKQDALPEITWDTPAMPEPAATPQTWATAADIQQYLDAVERHDVAVELQ